MSVPEAQGPAPFEVLRTWRSAGAAWRDRISVFPAVGSQPTKVYIDLSRLPGVEIHAFHPIQTDPAPAHALFALGNNPSATQAFTRLATALAECTEALATQLELVDIDSGRACLLAAALRSQPVLVNTEHLTMFEETELLGRRLDAKLKGLAQVATSEFVTTPPAADARPTHVAPSDFYELTLATLDDAKSLILFRRSRSSHPEWEALSRTIPPHLFAATDEWEDAKRDASLAQHEHEQALAGEFYNEWILPARRDREATVRALSERAEHAEARRVAAIELVNKTQHDRTVAENAVGEQWLRARAAAFRTRFAAYQAALQERLQTIEATRSGAYVLRGWKESCACTVLLAIGTVLLEVLDPTERETDWWGTLCLGERFDDLDYDAWRDLRIDVRQEAARVRGSQPTGAASAAGDALPDIDEDDYHPSSEASVTAIVRALSDLRTKNPDLRPTKERIKEVASVLGGAGDRAIEVAQRNNLVTPDLLVSAKGREFLRKRS